MTIEYCLELGTKDDDFLTPSKPPTDHFRKGEGLRRRGLVHVVSHAVLGLGCQGDTIRDLWDLTRVGRKHFLPSGQRLHSELEYHHVSQLNQV